MKLSYLAVIAAFFLGSGAEDKPTTPPSAPTNLAVVAARPEVLPVGPVIDVPEQVATAEVTVPELPATLRAVMNSKGGIRMLTLVHQGHLVTLRKGGTDVLGDNSISVPVKDASPIAWESTDRKTFETVRGVVEWNEQAGKAPTPQLRPTARVLPMREISSVRHDCKALDGKDEIVTVICRIDSLAVGAVRVFGSKPKDGIAMAESGEHRYFRMDLDTRKDDIDAVVVGYSDGVRGHVIRAEVSKLPGETKASFSLLEATRAQPIPVRFFRGHHHPHREIDFL